MDQNKLNISTDIFSKSKDNLEVVGTGEEELVSALQNIKNEFQTLESSIDARVQEQIGEIKANYDSKCEILTVKLSQEREKNENLRERANQTFSSILNIVTATAPSLEEKENRIRSLAVDDFQSILQPCLQLNQAHHNLYQNGTMQSSVLMTTIESQKEEISRLRNLLDQKRQEITEILAAKTTNSGTNLISNELPAELGDLDTQTVKSSEVDSAFSKTTNLTKTNVFQASGAAVNSSSILTDLKQQLDLEKTNYRNLEKSYERLYETVNSIQGMVRQIKVPDAFAHHSNEFLLDEIRKLKKALYEAEHGRLESREGQQEAIKLESKYKARVEEVEQQLHVYRQESEGWKAKYVELQSLGDYSILCKNHQDLENKFIALQDINKKLQETHNELLSNHRELDNLYRDLKYQQALSNERQSQSEARASLTLREAELEYQMKSDQSKRQIDSLQALLDQREQAWVQERQAMEKTEASLRESLKICESRRDAESKLASGKLETFQAEWRAAMEKANEKASLHHQEVMHWTSRHSTLTTELNHTANQLDQMKNEKEQLLNRINLELIPAATESHKRYESLMNEKQKIEIQKVEYKQALEQARTWWHLHVQSELCPIPASSECPFKNFQDSGGVSENNDVTNWNNIVIDQLEWAKNQFKAKATEKDERIQRFLESEQILKEKISVMEKQELAIREQLRALQESSKHVDEKLQSAIEDAQGWREKCFKCQDQIRILEQEKTRLESDLAHEITKLKELSNTLQIREDDFKRVQEERMDALEKIGHLESEVVREKSHQEVLTGKLKQSQQYSEGLELREQKTFEKMESLCNQITNLESEAKTNQETIERLLREEEALKKDAEEKQINWSERENGFKRDLEQSQDQILQIQEDYQAAVGQYEEKIRQVEYREQDLMMQLVDIQQQHQEQTQKQEQEQKELEIKLREKIEETSKSEEDKEKRGRSRKRNSSSSVKHRSRTHSVNGSDPEVKSRRARSLSVVQPSSSINDNHSSGMELMDQVLPPLLGAFITQTRLRRAVMSDLKSAFSQLQSEFESSMARMKSSHDQDKLQLHRVLEQKERIWKEQTSRMEQELINSQDALSQSQKESLKALSEIDQLRLALKDMEWRCKQEQLAKPFTAIENENLRPTRLTSNDTVKSQLPSATEQLSSLQRQLLKLEKLVTQSSQFAANYYPVASGPSTNLNVRRLEDQVDRLSRKLYSERNERLTLSNLLRSYRSAPQRKSTTTNHPWL